MDWSVNLWSVLAAAVAGVILGSLWYSPVLFGNLWMKLSGMKKPTGKELEKLKKTMWKYYLTQFIGTLVASYALAVLIKNTGSTGSLAGALLGAVIGVGVLSVNALSSVLWEGKPFKLYLINISYNIVSYVIMGAIIACPKWM